MFCHRQQLRRWAGLWLFLWLFSVGSSVANACLSSDAVTPVRTLIEGSAVKSTPDQEVPAQQGGHDHAGSAAHQHDGVPDHHSSPAKANCKDFCDRASVSVPTFKSSLDDLQGHVALPPAVVLVMPATPAQPAPMWVLHPIDVPTPPIPIAYLRLAL